MSERFHKVFDAYGKALKSLDQCQSQSLIAFYEALAQLERSPLRPVDFPQGESLEKLPSVLKSLVQQASPAFTLQKPWSEMLKPLKEFQEWCLNTANGLPEAMFLASQAGLWCAIIETRKYRPAELIIHLSPTLDLKICEEGIINNKVHAEKLPLAITNIGGQYAYETKLLWKSQGSRLLSAPLNEVYIKRIAPGETRIEEIPVSPQYALGTENVIARAEYIDLSESGTSSPKKFEMPRLGRNLSPELLNPYIFSDPIALDSKDLLFGNEKHMRSVLDIQSGIIEHLAHAQSQTTQQIFAVCGLKRSGKTSILRQIETELLTHPKCLPVYIDLHAWEYVLSQCHSDMDGQNLWYEMADSIIAAVQESGKDAEVYQTIDMLEESIRAFQESERMSVEDFEQILLKSYELTNKQHIFLLDDLNSWIESKAFAEDAKMLLWELTRLVACQGGAIVIAYEWSEQIDNKLNIERNFPHVYRVSLLNRDDTDRLAKLNGAVYTELALEFIWLITGGWPGLLQYLLFYLTDFKNRNRRAGHPMLITVEDVKKVVSRLIDLKDQNRFIGYLLSSFTPKEIELLRFLITDGHIREASSEISGVIKEQNLGFRFEDARDKDFPNAEFASLITKHIFEPNDPRGCDLGDAESQLERYRLRVGLLSYMNVLDLYRKG